MRLGDWAVWKFDPDDFGLLAYFIASVCGALGGSSVACYQLKSRRGTLAANLVACVVNGLFFGLLSLAVLKIYQPELVSTLEEVVLHCGLAGAVGAASLVMGVGSMKFLLKRFGLEVQLTVTKCEIDK